MGLSKHLHYFVICTTNVESNLKKNFHLHTPTKLKNQIFNPFQNLPKETYQVFNPFLKTKEI